MSRRKLILGILLVLLLLVVNGYRWFQGLPQEQAHQILYWLSFLLIVILPSGMVVAWVFYRSVRRVGALTRKKEPWEGDEIGP